MSKYTETHIQTHTHIYIYTYVPTHKYVCVWTRVGGGGKVSGEVRLYYT